MKNTSKIRICLLEKRVGSREAITSFLALAKLAGFIDGLHWPYRQHGGRVAVLTSIVQQRRAYTQRGLAWQAEGGDSRGWKRAQRLRDAMQSEGLIEIHRGTSLTVKLTTKGDTIARRSLGFPEASNWLPKRLATMLCELPEDRPGGWVSEFTLAGNQGDKFALAQVLLPLLSTGIVESLSSGVGEIFFRRTGNPVPTSHEPDLKTPKIEVPEELLKSYQDAFEATLSSRERLEAADPTEIVIPLSASKPSPPKASRLC